MWREHRLEVLLVFVLTVVAATYTRWAYIPPFSDRHVAVSEEKYHFDVGAPGPWFSAWSLGDGQAYAMIALDPTGEKLAEEVSEAAYRFSRASFGWVVWAVSLGQASLIPYALGVVGAICVLATLGLAIGLRQRLGERSWLLILNPAVFIGFAGDTSEPMAILLLGIALAVGSWVAAAALGVTSPTYLVAVWGRRKLLLSGVAAGAALASYSFFAFGADAMIPDGGRLAAPFVAFFEYSSVTGWGLAVAAMGTLVIGIRKRDWTWVISALFVLSFGSDVLRDPVNAWRVSGFLPVLWAFGPGYVGRVRSEATAPEPAVTG